MKNITTAVLCSLFLFFSVYSFGQILNESASWPNGNWTISGTYNGTGLLSNPTTDGTTLTWDDDGAGSTSDDDLQVTSPTIDLTSASVGGETWITINGEYVYNELGDILLIETYDADSMSWSVLETFVENSTSFSDYQSCSSTVAYTTPVLDISGFSTNQLSGFKYRINYDDQDGWRWGWCLTSPTITSQAPPSCIDPSDLTATATSLSEATLSWTGHSSATGYEVVVQEAGTGTPTSSGVAVSSTSYNATGLEENTSYEFYVLADCGTNGLSSWVGPYEFYMGYCDSVPSSNDGDGITSIILGSTTFTSAGDVTYEDFTDPIVDVSQAIETNLQITFATGFDYDTNVWIDFNGDLVYDNVSELVFDGESTNDNPTTLDASFTVPNGTPLGIYNLRIGTADSGQFTPNPCYNGSWGVTVDMKINITEPPSCVPPSDLTTTATSSSTASLSWTGDTGAIGYEVVVQEAGTGTPTSSGVAVGSTSYVATGLAPNTDYEFFVLTDCGTTTGSSTWAGPFYFTTLCDAISTIPYYEGFNSDSTTQNCWTVLNENGDSDEWNMDYTFNPFEGDEVAIMNTDFNSGSNDDWLISPGLVLTGNERLKFHQRVQSSFEPNDFEVLLSTTGMAPADFTNVISPLADYDNTDYIEYVFDLSAYSGTSYIAFHVPSGGLDGWRLYIDNFIVETIPACGYPSGLNITNITGTTADFDWVAQNGNESWEYVIVPNGDPAPTGAGVFTTVNSTTFTGLDFLTTYDVYVRAYCGIDDGYSIWSGPETFTTTQQTNYAVDCASGQPVNIEYCYTNNDTTFWVFTSTDGFPLKITFNAGTIEGGYDDISVFDGTDNTGTLLFNNNDADLEDLSGVVVESTSSSIYIEVDSDGSVGCSSSTTYTPWDFDVTCKTCITQTVEFDIVGSCEPNQEFYVEANITDMGGAVNLELTDNQGSAAQTASVASVLTFGPYAADTQVVISVLNTDDTSCLVESDTLTFLCPPPPNECSIIYAGEDTTFCSDNDPATELTAYYHITGQDTTSYEITVQQNCPTPSLVGGIPTSLDIDDEWSEVIDLGFEFCFFGDTYSQILIGSNGVLSFELDNAGEGNGYSLNTGDTLPNGSNSTIYEANIFGVGHDIDPSEGGEINYVILGSAPSRQFVVNYNEVWHFGTNCNQYVSTSQIILYESSNTIDINIFDKPICTDWNDGLAVVGIQNIDDTIAFTPPDRNTGAWETTNEFWRFTPSVGDANYTFGWYDGDTLVGTDDTITVYPEETTTYTAAVTYNLCSGETQTVTDTVLVEITPTPIPVAVENNVFICEGEEVVLEVNVDPSQESPDLIYYWTYDNVDVQFGPENTFVFEEGSTQFGEYLVTAYNEVTMCFASTTINVSPGVVPDLEDGTSFDKCANGEVVLSVNITSDPDMTGTYSYAWYIDNELMDEDTTGTFVHDEDMTNGPVVVVVTDLSSMCASETVIEVIYYQNQNCVDIPQGISPNGDGLNDCLLLDHLEAQEDIIKAEIFNRYGAKVFELNDYVDHWCGQDGNNNSSNELLPVGTYFYVIQYASGREPTISWIYLNY